MISYLDYASCLTSIQQASESTKGLNQLKHRCERFSDKLPLIMDMFKSYILALSKWQEFRTKTIQSDPEYVKKLFAVLEPAWRSETSLAMLLAMVESKAIKIRPSSQKSKGGK